MSIPWVLLLLRAISLLLVGLYSGGVFFTVIAPSVRRLPGDAYVRHWQAQNTDYRRAMPVLVIGGLVATLAAGVLSLGRGTAVVVLTMAAAVLVAGTIVITLKLLDPLNRAADAWNPSSLPDGWEAARALWQRWHLFRTVLAVTAFVCLLLAQMLDHRSG
ncbi:MAG: DUF1772 domain-containing protein [Propionibacteriaceae bacterium]|nr:DUF1772 domain-containing protein [Propionibacteriaceae bacterium]